MAAIAPASAETHTAELPPGWSDGHTPVRQTIGKSGALVFRLGDAHFVKSEPVSPLAELPGEIERLRWLHRTGLPCPEVVATADHDGRHWLMMTAIPGADLASTPDLPPATIVTLVAGALRALHSVDPAACLFDHRATSRIATATARFEAGLYDGDIPSEADAHHATLLATRPAVEDLVVTHGDACFPNFMAANGRFTGYIDCGRLGVADRYQDIALTCRSLRTNFGPAPIPTFLAAYGIAEPDQDKLAWYNLLDEFF
jgi:aminoglycoside 3'-phosphotransferase-2